MAGLPNSLHPDPIPAGLKDRWDLHWTEKDSRHDVIFAKRSLNFAIAVYYCSDHLVVQRQETPLHWAVWKGNEAMARLLLENGADVTAKLTTTKVRQE